MRPGGTPTQMRARGTRSEALLSGKQAHRLFIEAGLDLVTGEEAAAFVAEYVPFDAAPGDDHETGGAKVFDHPHGCGLGTRHIQAVDMQMLGTNAEKLAIGTFIGGMDQRNVAAIPRTITALDRM